jgi:hypothetical protein
VKFSQLIENSMEENDTGTQAESLVHQKADLFLFMESKSAENWL